MLSKKIEETLNKQINEETASSYIYLAMAAYLESKNLHGMASWMEEQSREELKHALKIYNFVNERGGRVKLGALAAPQAEWASAQAVFEEAYKHELKISGLINSLLTASLAEGDHATSNFLQWFVAEQVEEEASVLAIVEKFRMVGDHPSILYLLDKELGKRAAAE